MAYWHEVYTKLAALYPVNISCNGHIVTCFSHSGTTWGEAEYCIHATPPPLKKLS